MTRVSIGLLLWVALGAAAEHRPNFLVLLCDDLGYGDLGCQGHAKITSPNVDRLASEGLRLTANYAAAPVCSPSRCGMLTGRTPYRAGIYDWIPDGSPMHLQRDEITIASLLRDAGYETCHVGKWHCNGQFNQPTQPQPGEHGFQHWFSTQNNAAPNHHNPINFVRNGARVGKQEGYSSQVIVDEAIRWLGQRSTDKPFCLFVWFHEPHEPIESRPDLVRRHADALNADQAQFFANVEQMDEAVGRMVQAVDAAGQKDRTLVWFTSDNGPETLNRYPSAQRSHGSPGPLRGMKLHLYEGGIRVPGILRWPTKIAAGQVSDAPMGHVDLLPTLCTLAGVPLPTQKRLDGVSVAPLFEQKSIVRSQPLHWHYYRAIGPNKFALRDGEWKLLAQLSSPSLGPGRWTKEDVTTSRQGTLSRFELYHLPTDIGEQTDRSQIEPEVLQRLRSKMQSIVDEVKQEGPLWDFPPPSDPAAPKAKKVVKGKMES